MNRALEGGILKLNIQLAFFLTFLSKITLSGLLILLSISNVIVTYNMLPLTCSLCCRTSALEFFHLSMTSLHRSSKGYSCSKKRIKITSGHSIFFIGIGIIIIALGKQIQTLPHCKSLEYVRTLISQNSDLILKSQRHNLT